MVNEMIKQMPKIENIQIELCYMRESSGNEQIFVRARRKDAPDGKGWAYDVLEYECRQTKYGLTLDECIDQAVFSSKSLLDFFGLSKNDLVCCGFTDTMTSQFEKSTKRWLRGL